MQTIIDPLPFTAVTSDVMHVVWLKIILLHIECRECHNIPSVYSPCNLFQGKSTGSLTGHVGHLRTAMENQDGDLWTVCCDGHDPFIRHIQTMADVQFFNDFSTESK